MAGISESKRKQVALMLSGLGAVLIFAGFIIILSRSVDPGTVAAPLQKVSVPKEVRILALKHILFWMVVFFLIFAVSTIAFLRWSRRFRRYILRKPQSPTPSEDVWAMHKLPEGAIEEWTDEQED